MIKQAHQYYSEPKSVLDTVGLVLLANPDKRKLQEDYETLISWEKENKLF